MATLGTQLLQRLNQHQHTIGQLSHRYQIAAQSLTDAMVDPAFTLDGTLERDLVVMQIRESHAWASCYATAANLFQILTGVPPQNANFHGPNQEAKYVSGDAIRAEMERLIACMTQNENGVFRINYAGHGFTLVLREDEQNGPGQTELIESLAGTATIQQSLLYPPVPRDARIAMLRQLASDDVDQRGAGAGGMMGGWNGRGWNHRALYLGTHGDIKPNSNDTPFPQIRFQWWAAPLSSQWLNNWDQQIANRLQFLSG